MKAGIPMKAIVYHQYGSPDVLKYEEIEKPVPGDKEVLIKVRATSVNPIDWHFMRGKPGIVRLLTGLGKPKSPRLGVDVAGVIESVGSSVTRFKPGDAVFGSCREAFAEFARAPESSLALKPETVTFEQAGCVAVAALTALQGLRDKGHVRSGQDVLINGAAGGVGTFAVQIAKWMGAEVTAVCSTRNLEMVRLIGADYAIDYTQEDFTRGRQRYHMIFDLVGNHSMLECTRVLNPKGVYVQGGGRPDMRSIDILAGTIKRLALARFVSQKLLSLMTKITREDLNLMSELMEAGKVTPVIDRRYKLSEVPTAIRYLEEGHARGKVAITVD
jgi:NADPH:quinone reductase-like Zn-dependent oxidoreductase